jgi:hypothetical protein
MKDLLQKLFPTWVYWAAFVFTIAGVVFAIGLNLPWIGFMVILPALIAFADTAVRSHLENRRLRLELDVAVNQRTEAERQLQLISSSALLRFEEFAIRGSFDECFDSIYGFAAYVGRLQKLTKTQFDLRDVFVTGNCLYVAAKASAGALAQLREDDPFVMFTKRSGLNHPVAKLRLHQVNEKQEAIFLEVTGVLDEATVSSLRVLSQSASARGLRDFGMNPEVCTAAFAGEDMEAVTRALDILRDNINKAK